MNDLVLVNTGNKRHPKRVFTKDTESLKVQEFREVSFFTNSIRVNESNSAVHEAATNKYSFTLPQDWVTSRNEKKFLLRSISLKRSFRTVFWKMDINYSKSGQSVWDYSNWFWTFTPDPNSFGDFLQYLNQHLISDIAESYSWIYDEINDTIILQQTFNTLIIHEIKIESFHTFDPIGKIDAIQQFSVWSVIINMWNRGEILVKTDIIDGGVLGFTGQTFDNPKTYVLDRPTPTVFNIELFDSLRNVECELPSDNKDYIVIDAVLT
jgi:hypothetical protein